MYPKLNSDVYLARNHPGLLTPPFTPSAGVVGIASVPSYLSVLFETGYHQVGSWPNFVAKAGFNLLFLLPLPLEF